MSHNGVATSGARPAGVPRLALNRVGTGSAGAFGSTSASARSAASAARVPQPPTHSSSARRGGFRNSARRTNHAGTASARVPHSYTVRSRSQSPRSARGAATSSGSAVVKIRAPLIDVPSKAFRRNTEIFKGPPSTVSSMLTSSAAASRACQSRFSTRVLCASSCPLALTHMSHHAAKGT